LTKNLLKRVLDIYPWLFLTNIPNWSVNYYAVYSFYPLNAKLLGQSVNPNSWINTNLPNVINPTNVSSGNKFNDYYKLSFIAFNSSYVIHVSIKNKNIFGSLFFFVSIYSIVEYYYINSAGKFYSFIKSA